MTTPEPEGGESVEEHEYPYEPEPGKTHWEDCWKAPGHHNCAVARVYRLRRALMAYEGALRHASEYMPSVSANAEVRSYVNGYNGPDFQRIANRLLNEAERSTDDTS